MDRQRQRTHEQSRTLVCAACGQKIKSSAVIKEGLADILREEVFPGYDREDTYFPNGICNTCRANLFKAKRGEEVPVAVRDRWHSMDYNSYRPHHVQRHAVAKFAPLFVIHLRMLNKNPNLTCRGNQMKTRHG